MKSFTPEEFNLPDEDIFLKLADLENVMPKETPNLEVGKQEILNDIFNELPEYNNTNNDLTSLNFNDFDLVNNNNNFSIMNLPKIDMSKAKLTPEPNLNIMPKQSCPYAANPVPKNIPLDLNPMLKEVPFGPMKKISNGSFMRPRNKSLFGTLFRNYNNMDIDIEKSIELSSEIQMDTLKIFCGSFIILYIIYPNLQFLNYIDEKDGRRKPRIMVILIIAVVIAIAYFATSSIDVLDQLQK